MKMKNNNRGPTHFNYQRSIANKSVKGMLKHVSRSFMDLHRMRYHAIPVMNMFMEVQFTLYTLVFHYTCLRTQLLTLTSEGERKGALMEVDEMTERERQRINKATTSSTVFIHHAWKALQAEGTVHPRA